MTKSSLADEIRRLSEEIEADTRRAMSRQFFEALGYRRGHVTAAKDLTEKIIR